MPWRIWWLSSISRRDPDPGASAGPPRVDPRPRAGPSAGPSIVSPWVTSAILLMRHAMSNGQRPGSFPATNSQNPEAMERHAPTRCLLHLCPGRYSFAAPLGTARTRHARSDRAGARPLLDWVEAELLGVERSRPLQILRGQPRRNANTRKHDRSPPRLPGSPRIQSKDQAGLSNPFADRSEAVSPQATRSSYSPRVDGCCHRSAVTLTWPRAGRRR